MPGIPLDRRSVAAADATSRAEIARRTELSRPVVSEIVAELVAEGFVREVGRGPSRVGKRPTVLRVDEDGFRIGAVELRGDEVETLLADLRGHVLWRRVQPTRGATGSPLVQTVRRLTVDLTTRSDRPLLGLAISSPGLVDLRSGVVRYAANLGLQEVAATDFAPSAPCPVWVINDTDAAALGELFFGAGQGASPMVVVHFGVGIGAGIVIDGHIYAGRSGGSGEVGHSVVVPGGARCSCGKQGCLETVASLPAVLRQAGWTRSNGASMLDAGIAFLQERLAAGDAPAVDAVRQAAYFGGLAVAQMANILNPQRVLVIGPLVGLGEPFIGGLEQAARQHALAVFAADMEIKPGALGDRSGILGAVALVLSQHFTAPDFLAGPPAHERGYPLRSPRAERLRHLLPTVTGPTQAGPAAGLAPTTRGVEA